MTHFWYPAQSIRESFWFRHLILYIAKISNAIAKCAKKNYLVPNHFSNSHAISMQLFTFGKTDDDVSDCTSSVILLVDNLPYSTTRLYIYSLQVVKLPFLFGKLQETFLYISITNIFSFLFPLVNLIQFMITLIVVTKSEGLGSSPFGSIYLFAREHFVRLLDNEKLAEGMSSLIFRRSSQVCTVLL